MEKGLGMPNDKKTGLKNQWQVNEAVWHHLNRKQNKRQSTSKEELWDVLPEAWRTISEDYLQRVRRFRLC